MFFMFIMTFIFTDKVNDEQKLRGGVHFVEELPRVSIGKVQRKLLREMSLTKTV